MKKRLVNLALAAISGILAFMAFPPLGFSFMAWICLVPLLFLVKRTSVKGAFWYSYLSGAVFFGLLLHWLINVTVPGTVVLVLLLSITYGLFGSLAALVFKYSLELLILPFAWVVLEYIRSYLFTGFPWGLLAHSQYRNINIIQIADVMGSYGISFILALFNVAFFSYIVREKRRVSHLAAALALILVAVTYGICRLNNYAAWGSARMSVVQGNIPQRFKWDPQYAGQIIKEYETLTREAAREETDMIIWPETAYPYLVDSEDGAPEIKKLAAGAETPVLAGVVYKDRKDFFNSAVLFSEKGKFVRKYHKIHLVPLGEYVPMERYLPFLRKYIDKPIGDYVKGKEYTLFPLRSLSLFTAGEKAIKRSVNFYKFGVLICFEDIFPYITREFARRGADLVVNITNDAWFNAAAAEQHLQASVFRAVENRVPVVRAANTGVSCFVDSTGEVLSRVKLGGKDTFVGGVKTDSVRVSGVKSFYTRHGDVFAFFCGFMVTLVFFIEMFLTKKERNGK